ncbi:MAG: hypothetical protein RRA92_01235 [Gemmatimonadota bacterium]|nr:hypothetical protein [Gemmatimonadota bacterium]
MISEIVSGLTPAQVVDEAKRFFTGEGSLHAASIVEESETSLTVSTFRSRIALAAFPDPEGNGTRVRISTLRSNDAIGKLLTYLETNGSRGGPPAASDT